MASQEQSQEAGPLHSILELVLTEGELKFNITIVNNSGIKCNRPASRIQGYLAHKKTPPLKPYSSPMPRALWWS